MSSSNLSFWNFVLAILVMHLNVEDRVLRQLIGLAMILPTHF